MWTSRDPERLPRSATTGASPRPARRPQGLSPKPGRARARRSGTHPKKRAGQSPHRRRRAALGADPSAVLKMVMAASMRMVAGGLVLGVGGALVAGRVMRGLLCGIGPMDPLALAAGLLILGGAGPEGLPRFAYPPSAEGRLYHSLPFSLAVPASSVSLPSPYFNSSRVPCLMYIGRKGRFLGRLIGGGRLCYLP